VVDRLLPRENRAYSSEFNRTPIVASDRGVPPGASSD
jgi:hypothetical protein